jgi:O-antigen ligase
MSGWLSTETIFGVAIAAAFFFYAQRQLSNAVYAYAVLGAVPWIQVGAFSGNEMVQGLALAEVLATALFLAWLLRRSGAAFEPAASAAFNRWLFLILPFSALSLVSGWAWLDHTVPLQNVKLSVSIGQVMLFAWPMGVYLVAADQVRTVTWIERFRRTVIWLAIPQVVMLAVPRTGVYLSWSWYFGLIAAPLAMASLKYEPSVLRRLGLVALALLPAAQGVATGKAFLYLYVIVSTLVVLWIRARRLCIFLAFALGMAGIVSQFVPPRSLLPGFVEQLEDEEVNQQSWGGRSGRDALAVDAVNIWSGHPLLGVGPGNSYPYMLRYSVIGTPHSQYLNLLVEQGIVGVMLFVAFVAGVIRFGFWAISVRRAREEEVFLLGWFASFVAWSFCSITGDYMLHSIRNGGIEMFTGYYIHWVFLGAAVGVARGVRGVELVAVASPTPDTWQVRPGREVAFR